MSDCPECPGTDHPSHRQHHSPPLPEPDRWHVEDDARVPTWDLAISNITEVAAWTDGVQLDDDFQDAGPDVDEIETFARKLRAAVAWHRHGSREAAEAAADAARTNGDET